MPIPYNPGTMNMWRPALIKLGDSYLSDHNREPVSESRERIENAQRMANGLMRKYVIADKKTWTVSWTMLPSLSSQTIDGYMGAMALREFYEANYDNTITLSFYSGTSSLPTQAKLTNPAATYTATVYISDFSATINKRLGDIDYWDCSISFVEA